MSKVGDLSDFLKEGSIVDLSWLDVDDAEYRALDTLPKQNLDIAPDLQMLWGTEDRPSAGHLMPNTGAPKTMGDLSQIHGKLAADQEASVAKVARYALMQSTDSDRFRQALTSRFDRTTLRAAKHVIKAALDERGLLGRYYIDSADFSGCHNSPKNVVSFVRKFANDAKFVKAKSECNSCVHAKVNPTGGTNCAVFHKQIVVEVPYTESLAQKVEQVQRAKGYVVEASADAEPKKRVKLAMLAPTATTQVVDASKPVVNPAHYLRPVSGMQEVVTKARDLSFERTAAQSTIETAFKAGRLTVEEAQIAFKMASAAGTPEALNELIEKIASLDFVGANVYQGTVQTAHPMATHHDVTAALTKREVVKTASRYMNEGLYGSELLDALKKRFDKRDLVAAKDELRAVIAEQGLQGVYYVDPTVYSDYGKGCNEAERLHRARLVPFVRQASACTSCVHNREGRCSKINKPLVVEPPYHNKLAQQREILSSGPATSIPYDQLVNNGASMMAEFEMQREAAEVEVAPAPKTESFSIEFGVNSKVKL